MTSDKYEKTLDKIKKCMALASSSNANEAATALRQAQKLMQSIGIDEGDLERLKTVDESIDVPIQKNIKAPMQLTRLINLIMGAFGVKAILEDRIGVSDVSYRVRYFGPDTRVPLACYAHRLVFRAMETSWKEHLAAHPYLKGVRAARASFQVGWLAEVSLKVEAIGFTNEEEHSVSTSIEKHYGGTLSKTKSTNMGLYGKLMGEGASAAKDFSIHRPMDGAKQKLLS